MTMPLRIQLSRRKGWRMPPNTVKVDRSTRWGNPWRIGDNRYDAATNSFMCCETTADTVLAFRQFVDWDPGKPLILPCAECGHLEIWGGYSDEIHLNRRSIRKFLAGKNLACWCKLGEPCHADVLLELANRPICKEVS